MQCAPLVAVNAGSPRRRNRMRKQSLAAELLNQNGFTLTELLVVITIVGLLAALAIPSYLEHVTKTRRSEGQAALFDVAERMERYYSQNNTYETATIATGNAITDLLTTAQTAEDWYAISIAAQTASSYTLQATPQGAQSTSDTRCQSLTINSLGAKSITDGPSGTPTGAAADCW